MISFYCRGHKILHTIIGLIYDGTLENCAVFNRSCIKCDNLPTKDGHDYCIQNLKGIKHACCGHGVTKSFIIYE